MNISLKGKLIPSALFLLLFIQIQDVCAEKRKSVTRWEITWSFDKEYECGQFINGDWWVIGPVKVVKVTPGPRKALPVELNKLGKNRWGDTGMNNDSSLRNGSMVVMKPVRRSGYDSRNKSYDSTLTISFPYELGINRTLISSVSNDTIPQKVLYNEIMWPTEQNTSAVLKTAAVLTCLKEAPPEDAFRPTYIGAEKKIFRYGDVKWDKLLNLEPTSSMPSWEQFERYLERTWLDHMNGSWHGQWLLPTRLNQPCYGREYVRIVSKASLMLNTKASKERKKKLLIGLIQLGIDFRGIAEVGGKWNEGGGHTSGRKWPILFAGIMLDDEWFFHMPAKAIFHEDTETYYGNGWAGQTALWQMVGHHGVRLPYMQEHPKTWDTYDDGWAKHSEGYRRCCNAQAWTGEALAALLMEAKSIWSHDAFFDVVDDWMREEDIYFEYRDGPRPPEETKNYPPFDNFVTEMWRQYRDSVPKQANGTISKMWDSSLRKWVDNPPPSKTAAPSIFPKQENQTGATFISINTTTPDADIYYTTDGSIPTKASEKYEAPFIISKSSSVKAIALKGTMEQSEISIAQFNIRTDKEAPIIKNVPVTFESNKVYVEFNEPMQKKSTSNASNYIIEGVNIISCDISNDLQKVILNTSQMSPGVYSLIIKRVKDFSGNKLKAKESHKFQYLNGVESNTQFQTFDLETQKGKFSVEFDAVPLMEKMNGGIGLLSGTAKSYGDLACIVLFSPKGAINVRSGKSYRHTNKVKYSKGKLYHIKMMVDIESHTYSVFVTPLGEGEVQIAKDYAFRSEQTTIAEIKNWSFVSSAGSQVVGNFKISK